MSSPLPWALKGYAVERLSKLDAARLRALCTERSIPVEDRDGVDRCVAKLLEWKKRPTAEPAGGTDRPDGARPAGEGVTAADAPDSPPARSPPTDSPPARSPPTASKPERSPPTDPKPRGGNVNVIAFDSSRRLALALKPALADAVLTERRLNGDFADFADLRARVPGVGPKAVQALEAAGFCVRPRAAGGEAEGEAAEGGVRLNVSGMGEQVWRHRDGRDLYTQMLEPAVLAAPGGAEVDHVWECQLVNDAHDAAVGEGGPAARTRAVLAATRALFNGAENLNVTTHAVNQTKKGPFSRWRHQRERAGRASLADLVRETAGGKKLVDEGHWARITTAVVAVWDELDERKEQIRAARPREHTDAVLRHMHAMMGEMELT
jgi:hypothetical protein